MSTYIFRQSYVETGEGTVKVLSMNEDGNCFYTALAKGLNPELNLNSEELQNISMEYRAKVSAYLVKNIKTLTVFLLPKLKESPISYKQRTNKAKVNAYINNIKNGTEWGGDESAHALSNELKVNIRLYQEKREDERDPMDSKTLEFNAEKAEQTIGLVYRVTLDPEERSKPMSKRNHYDLCIGPPE